MCEDCYELGDVFPPGRGEYKVHDTITFTEDGAQLTGQVIHVGAPGTTATGREHPTFYLVDTGNGFPTVVYQSDIIAQ